MYDDVRSKHWKSVEMTKDLVYHLAAPQKTGDDEGLANLGYFFLPSNVFAIVWRGPSAQARPRPSPEPRAVIQGSPQKCPDVPGKRARWDSHQQMQIRPRENRNNVTLQIVVLCFKVGGRVSQEARGLVRGIAAAKARGARTDTPLPSVLSRCRCWSCP